MSKIRDTFAYSVGKKLIMALTGLFLITFLIEHLIGNMLLLLETDEWFLLYAEIMGSTANIPIRIMEVMIFVGFIFHIVDGLLLARANGKARPQKYAVKAGSKNSTWFSRNMHWTGIVILVFLVLHLISFFIEARFGIDVDITGTKGEYMEGDHVNLYDKVHAHFSVLWYVIIYVLSMVFLAFHLNHGFQSAFQTVGWRHKKYFPAIKMAGTIFAWLWPLGYAAIPLIIYIKGL